ncbi:hypothetical protein Tco_1069274 [Tanacetum coccineum]|uniref:Uncharacterized protein n=1 Tax=Tanacetum coccineum TaxID=301880 RepID=A0ABQ5HI04_9ASTR
MDNEVGVTSPESTTQTLLSFKEYTPPVTYPEEVEKTLGTLIEVEHLNETKLEEVGLNCNHNTPLSSREVPSFDGSEPQPLLNSPSLVVSLGDVIGPELPIKPHSLNSSRMKVVYYLTTQTSPSPQVENSHPKGVDISKWEMFDNDWGLESKKVSPLGEELSLFDRPNKVERGRKANLLEDKQIPSVGVFDEVFSTWMAFGGNTHDLGLFGEETDKITDLHQFHEEILFSERRDGFASIKRRRRDPSNDGFRDLVTASGCGRLNEDLESST